MIKSSDTITFVAFCIENVVLMCMPCSTELQSAVGVPRLLPSRVEFAGL